MKTCSWVAALSLALLLFVGTANAAWIVNPANGHFYALTPTATGWTAAEATAVSMGGHLATINDAAEETWLRANLGTGRLWIGFTDTAVEGTWRWTAGDGGVWYKSGSGSTSYANWADGEPNDAGSNEDYAVMNWNAGSTAWNDLPGASPEYLYRGIVEAVPVPPSLLLFAPGLVALALARRRRRG